MAIGDSNTVIRLPLTMWVMGRMSSVCVEFPAGLARLGVRGKSSAFTRRKRFRWGIATSGAEVAGRRGSCGMKSKLRS